MHLEILRSVSVFAASEGAAFSKFAEDTTVVFIAEIAAMLIAGRLLGEVLQRLGQPAVMGQLIAGVLLGPSVLGSLWPAGQHALFPDSPEQKKMIDAIAQLGILMLLLLTGMETDLKVVKQRTRTAVFGSLSGILLPFACGYTLGEMLPDALLPNPSQRLATSLFLATTLSISSVKIVAMVLTEVGFMRRTIGQVILASAIIDDTIGWVIIAIIGGLVGQGAVDLHRVLLTIGGTLAFLAVSFTVGRRVVAFIIRWTNDHFTIEIPVITAILVLAMGMALVTEFIGVHTVLGAFVAGILVGQSPILTRHIEDELRGLILALFAPVFFAVAGLSIDLRILASPRFILLALGLIFIASFGKIAGCFGGGLLGGLTARESTALAFGMNARGSTEVIVATIGLGLGVLTRDMFTLIVVMAIATTMLTPPVLRWALARVPATGEERARLEREKAEADDFLPTVERVLIAADASANGRLASLLGGMVIGARHLLSTALDLEPLNAAVDPGATVRASADAAANKRSEDSSEGSGSPEVLSSIAPQSDAAEAILAEAAKGFDLMFLGLRGALDGGRANVVERVAKDFEGAIAVAVSRGARLSEPVPPPMSVLVPTTGADYSRRAAELAIAIAKACDGSVTAVHVSPRPDASFALRHSRELADRGRALLDDVRELGARAGVPVRTVLRFGHDPDAAIVRQVRRGDHRLVVFGAKLRTGDQLYFGQRASVLIDRLPCSFLIATS
jgi:Kef-type K+ transport system membrane component KefB/nucleotide-binding universal stress UspA family protein